MLDSTRPPDEPLRYTYVPSPVGELLLAGDDTALHRIGFAEGPRVAEKAPPPSWRRDEGAFEEARRQLDAWFAGELHRFELPLALHGTSFQRRVWRRLAEIPYGETRTYGELATALGAPTASRAVGAANGRNPLPIVLPCHRVIGADGSLTGFGGGLAIKRRLLEREAAALGIGQMTLI